MGKTKDAEVTSVARLAPECNYCNKPMTQLIGIYIDSKLLKAWYCPPCHKEVPEGIRSTTVIDITGKEIVNVNPPRKVSTGHMLEGPR